MKTIEYTPESMKQEATNLLDILIHDEGIYYEFAGILAESDSLEEASIRIRAFAQDYFDEYEHFFNIFDMEEIDWFDFTKQLHEFDNNL